MASIKKIEGKGGVSYKITVSMGRDAHDKQIRHYKTWRPDRPMTERQIEKAVQKVAYEFERELSIGFQADNRQTFKQYAAYVYDLHVQRGDKPQSLFLFKRQIERISLYIGHLKLSDIRPQHLNNMYKALAQPGENHSRYDAEFIGNIGNLRYEGETWKGFAERCGVDIQVISRLRKGKYIKPKNAEKIEKNLNKPGLFRIISNTVPLSSITISNYHCAVSTVLAQGEKEMIIPYNPATRATVPKRKKSERASLQPEDVHTILAALENEPINFRTMITMFIVTGCRRGEILALKWSKIDFARCQVLIDKSVAYLPGKGVFEGGTKTNTSRTIAIPQQTIELLRKYRAWQTEQRLQAGDLWEDLDLVFTNGSGGLVFPASVNHSLSAFCEKNGFPHIHPHIFRHTAASILLSNGVDVLSVSKMLGHSDTSTTLDVYAHEIEEAKIKTADCIADTILRKKNA